ncbi:MAG: DUF1178 family protein [Comamonadaceae bacterium]
MKVLDIQCRHKHVFEGWFASEADFLAQLSQGLVECPVCGDVSITKRLSAPRLNLVSARADAAANHDTVKAAEPEPTLQAAWMALARHVLANTDDVGDRFAEEARKIHYGETKERGIRGRASRGQTDSLLDEGIAVTSMLMPEALKSQMH